MRMKKSVLIPLALALLLPLAGCRGGGLVFKGFHENQDKALLERLAEYYPKMEFHCTGQVEGSRHTMEAADGTRFTAWTAPGSKGTFQIITHYLEEWLAAQGFYSDVENKLTDLKFSWEYESYNYYDRHFSFDFGALDDPERLAQAVEALAYAHGRFDELYEQFTEAAGSGREPVFYLSGRFTLKGEEHFANFQIAPPTGVWNFDYEYDDYARYFDWYLEEGRNGSDIPSFY